MMGHGESDHGERRERAIGTGISMAACWPTVSDHVAFAAAEAGRAMPQLDAGDREIGRSSPA